MAAEFLVTIIFALATDPFPIIFVANFFPARFRTQSLFVVSYIPHRLTGGGFEGIFGS